MTNFVIAFGVLFWLFKPVFHSFLMWFYTYPAFWELLALTIGVALLVGAITKSEGTAAGVALAVFITGGIIFGITAYYYPQVHLANSLKVNATQELPKIDPNYVRIAPMVVANRYVKDAIQYPRYRQGVGDIAMIGNTPHWMDIRLDTRWSD